MKFTKRPSLPPVVILLLLSFLLFRGVTQGTPPLGLTDAINALRGLTRQAELGKLPFLDINNDGKTGVEEVIYILRGLAMSDHGDHGLPDTIAVKGGACLDCHDNDTYNPQTVVEGIHNNACADCHSAPPTLAQVGNRPNAIAIIRGGNCLSCHGSTYEHERLTHGKITYGFSAEETSCTVCHQADILAEHSTVRGYGCQICHQSPAYNGIVQAAMGSANNIYCSACHADQTASHANHIHNIGNTLDCGGCHNALDVINGIHVGQNSKHSCQVCHSHEGQNDTVGNAIAAGKAGSRQTCTSCHGTRYGHSVALAGSHQAITVDDNQNCAQCHAANLTAFANFNELVDLHRNSCATCHANRQSVAASQSPHPCSLCHAFVNTPGTGAWHHATSSHTQAGECEYCHNDPRLTAPNSGFSKPAGFSAPPTHLACEECHVQPKTAATNGTLVNTRVNGWAEGTMTILAFDKGSDAKKSASHWATAYARSTAHSIPNTAGQINTWGICLGCHDGSHRINAVLAPAVQPQHALPATVSPSQSYCWNSVNGFGLGMYLPGRALYNDISNMNYFGDFFRPRNIEPSGNNAVGANWGNDTCGEGATPNQAAQFTGHTRANGRTHKGVAMPTTAATPAADGEIQVPNPWTGTAFNNYTPIDTIPSFAAQPASLTADKVVITQAWWQDNDGVAGGPGVLSVTATAAKNGVTLALTGHGPLANQSRTHSGAFAMSAKPASITVSISAGGAGSATYTLGANDDRTCYTCGPVSGTMKHPAGFDALNAHPSCSTSACHGTSGNLVTVHKPDTSCTQCHGVFDANGNDNPGSATPKAINDWIADPANADSAGMKSMAAVIAQGMANNPLVTCKTCHSGHHLVAHNMTRYDVAPGVNCTLCHAQQAADPGNPDIVSDHLGRHTALGAAINCDTCHANPALAATIQSAQTGNLVLCSACHNGTLAPAYQTNHAAHDLRVTATPACTVCHTATAGTSTLMPVSATNDKLHDACATCHSANGALKAPYGTASAMSAGDCLHCHGSYFANHIHSHTIMQTAADLAQATPGAPCSDCHTPTPGGLTTWASVFAAHKNDCSKCHASARAEVISTIASKDFPTKCLPCHSDKATPATHAQHGPTAFAPSAACIDCHAIGPQGIVAGIHQNNCTTCHRSQFGGPGTTILGSAANGIDGDARLGNSAAPHNTITCLTCHPLATYPLALVHHVSASNYAAEGNCTQCHKSASMGGTPFTRAADHSTTIVTNVTHGTYPNIVNGCTECHRLDPSTGIDHATDGTHTGAIIDDGVDNPRVHDTCTSCHNTDATQKNISQVVHADHMVAGYNPGHGAGYIPDLDQPATCFSCHGPDPGIIHLNHDHTLTVGNSPQCNWCHYKQLGLQNGASVDPNDNLEHDACSSCHPISKGIPGDFSIGIIDPATLPRHIVSQMVTPQSKGGPVNCTDCHSNHLFNDHLKANHTMVVAASSEGCTTSCHSATAARPAPTFGVPIDPADNKVHDDCTSCHNTTDGALRTVAEVNKPYVVAMPNGPIVDGHNEPNDGGGECSACHGAAFFSKHTTVDHSTKVAGNAMCTGCHSNMAGNATGVPVDPTDNKQHDSCASCHDLATGELKAVTAPGGNGPISAGDCVHCHATVGQNAEAYHHANPEASNGNCGLCHSQQNSEWMASGHGDATSVAFTYASVLSTTCGKCHTATGFIDYIKDGVVNTAPTAHTMVNCSTCHIPGATHYNDLATNPKLEPVAFPSALTATFGNASNLCITCHQGRSWQGSVDAKALPGSFVNIHYFPAGATLFGTETKGGYEYAGKTYRGKNTFVYHAADKQDCVGCHLRGNAMDHTMEPALTDCTGCHGGNSFETLGGSPGLNYGGIVALNNELYGQIKAYAQTLSPGADSIVYDAATNPYWFKDNDGNGVKDSDDTTSYSFTDRKLLAACYNYQFSQKEPAAFIHNGTYMRELLFDAIMDLNPMATPPGGRMAAAESSCSLCHANRSADALAAHDMTAFLAKYSVSGLQTAFVDHDSNPATNPRFMVTFTVMDDATPVTNLAEKVGLVRVNLAKLIPGVDGSPSTWANYIGTTTTSSRPTTVSSTATNLRHLGAGVYAFTLDGATGQDVMAHPLAGKYTWDDAATHRVALQISGTFLDLSPVKATNAWLDFVPNGGQIADSRDITTMASCNACHEKINIHGGGRYAPEYCVTCHTDDRANGRLEATNIDESGNFVVVPPATSTSTYMVDGFALGDFTVMIHKIHMGNKLTRLGYDYAGVLFNEITYPQEQANCRKCHSAAGPFAATDGDNWKNQPSRKACGACHDNINFTSPTPAFGLPHTGGVQLDDSACATTCHTPAAIEEAHVTANATINNPEVPAGAANFTYDIKEVTAVANGDGTSSPQVTFRVLKDGVPLTAWVAGTNPLTGFTGAPSFLVAYAASQDGINAPADFNNLGKTAAQPASISLNTLAMNTQTPDSEGYYTITLTATTAKFPANAGMRAVALQGYFTQLSPAVARHTLSVVKTVTGDAVRRAIVDAAKCAGCHEVFEGHGGNRNIGFESTGTVVCVLCHNPNLSSSGRGADLSTSASNTNTLATIALHGNNPLTYPEDTNNFKDMIHAIHASDVRAVPFEFVRDRGSSGVYSYDFSEVTFPANVKSCTLCHLPGTFDPTRIPGAALDSTLVTTDGTNATPAAVKAARVAMPNATDRVIDPLTATCTSCHALSGVDNGHGARARGADAAITPHAMGFSFTESCQACHTGSDVVAHVHGNSCGLCHTGKPSRDNESSLAMLANGTAAAGSWASVNCRTCHVEANAPHHDTPTAASGNCAFCHTGENAEWATSGHGDPAGEAWLHYDWDGRDVNPPATNRQTCQRCHTATGAINYMTDPATYNPANNNFSHLGPGQNELLTCKGCHTASTGRQVPTFPNGVTFPSTLVANIGDASNLCMACHQGRASKNDVDAKVLPGSFVNIHYFPAAAVFFGAEVKGGYEYDGKTYAGRNTFAYHPAGLNTCIGCHMRGADKNHAMRPDIAACTPCHGGSSFETLGGAPAANHADIAALAAALYTEIKDYAQTLSPDSSGMVYDPATNPYWFKDNDGNGVKDLDDTTSYSFTDRKLLAAAYNYQTAQKEPCGFIHNGTYLRQLLADSILDLNSGATLPVARDLDRSTPHANDFAWAGNCSTCHDTSASVVAGVHASNCLLCHVAAGGGTRRAATNGDATLAFSKAATCLTCHPALATPDNEVTLHHNTDTSANCATCHPTVKSQWAASGHGDANGDPWLHYDWDGMDANPPATNRQTCQRCHTATGAINYMTDPLTYNPANNNFSHLGPGQNELLTCTGCHTASNDRHVPAFLNGVTFPSTLVANLNDASNLCMTCHQGRASKNDVDAKVLPGSFVNIHYFPAAAVFFGAEVKGGYEYDSKTYAGRNTFAYHPVGFNTCIGCHMRGADKNHEMLPDVNACAACHGGSSFETLGGSPGVNHANLAALADALYSEIKTYAQALSPDSSSMVYDPATNPYWFKDNDGNGVKDLDDTTSYSFTDRKLLAAAYNYQTAQKEPAAFIHNAAYVRQLLFDAIMDLNPMATPPGGRMAAAESSCSLCHANRSADALAAHDMTAFLAKYSISGLQTAFVDHDSNPATNPRFMVTFTVMDGAIPVTNLTEKTGLVRINLAKLIPGVDGRPSSWANYIGTTTTTSRPTTVSSTATNLLHLGAGVYAFTLDGATGQDVMAHPLAGKYTWDDAATHRVALQISGTFLDLSPVKATNAWLDFVPNGGQIADSRDITTTASCNACHEKINIHGGGRYAPEYCVTCHTDDRANGRLEATNIDESGNFVVVAPATSTATYVVDGFSLGDFPVMIHKIHMGNKLSRLGYDYAGVLFNEITYPQEQANCRKCHSASGPFAATDGDNWKNQPSRKACGACHDNINFTSPTPAFGLPHTGGVQLDDSACATTCHTPAAIEEAHVTANATINNPEVPAGAANFTYDLKEVTAVANGDGTNSPQVTFRVLKDGVPLTAWVAGTNPLAGFTGAPSFLVAYAVSQDGVNAPADFNNLGKAAAQPTSISLNTLAMNTQTPDSEGYYTITLTATTAKFPANAGMRTVALQGYFTQLSPAVARHTLSVVKTVTGDAVRRAIVDAAKCAGCHEVFEGHGGNRNIGFESTGTVVCVLCHNPSLSSSGRGADLSTSASNTNTQATIALHGNDPLTYPEDTNNFKDMIHAIHASAVRAVPFEFVRDRGSSGVYSYDFSEVTFPANVKSCTLCHLPGTFDPTRIPGAALDSTLVTTDGVNATPAAVKAARVAMPNATDRVIDPLTATCTSCHALSGVDNGHGPRARGADAAITPHAMGFSFTESCQACHTGSDVVVDVHGNACGLCHTGKPSRNNESSLAMLANGTAAAGSWASVNCRTCHVEANAPHHDTPTAESGNCAFCHTGENAEWATSGHGDPAGEAWVHYDWDGRDVNPPATNRQTCQRCHTATGAINYMTDPAAYNPANNDFSHLGPGQNELLTCKGCHTASTGRQVAAFPNGVTFPSTLVANLNDASNLCMACHQGRASKNDVDAKVLPGSFVNIHYFPAAAVFFGAEVKGGYEYDGKTYAGRNTFAYHPVGLNTCIGCHMRGTDKNHAMRPDIAACTPCHGGASFETLGGAPAANHADIAALAAALYSEIKAYAQTLSPDSSGMVYDPATNPYWFKDNDGNGVKDLDDTTSYSFTDRKLLAAAYNYQTAQKEPCGFIHNGTYLRQLLADSILDLNHGATLPVARDLDRSTPHANDFAWAGNCNNCHDTSASVVAGVHGSNCLLCHVAAGGGTRRAATNGDATLATSKAATCLTCHPALGTPDNEVTLHHNTDTSANCATCHPTVNSQWTASGHGDANGDPWLHYDWDGMDVNPPATNRQACQRCHTATGAINYMTDPAVYNPANNNFSHLGPGQNELLTCTGCHTASNDRHVPALPNGVTFPSTLVANLGDASNLCMTCHQGRASKNDVDAKVLPGSFVNIHYFPAAAVFFGAEVKGGYEYDGKTYAGRNTFAYHPAGFNTCIGCHMRGADKNHEMLPDVNACTACHGGSSFETLGGSPSVNHANLAALSAALYSEIKTYAQALSPDSSSMVYDPATNPYWFKDNDGNGVKDPTDTTSYSFTDRKLLAAAYNYQTAQKEPAAFIHNAAYVRQLLFDAIMDLNPMATPPGGRMAAAESSCSLCHANRSADALAAHDMTAFLAKYSVSGLQTAFVDHDANPATNPRFMVTFTVMDGATPVTNLTEKTGLVRINLAKLIPGIDGSPSTWANYIGTTTTTSRPTTVSSTATNLRHLGAGVYAFTLDGATGQDVMAHPLAGKYTWDDAATHRVALQISGTFLDLSPVKATNAWLDFVPNGGPLTASRDITTTASCNACHEKINIHGGGRYAPEFCVTCHTDDRANGRLEATNIDESGNFVVVPPATSTATYVVDGFSLGDFPVMIHKIHMGNKLTRLGYDYAGVLFNEITYPQEQANCRKCHSAAGPFAATDGDNWKNQPSRKACGACHDNINFTNPAPSFGLAHTGGVQLDDSACATTCHTPAAIEEAHVTANATINNPEVPAGAANFAYDLKEVTTVSNGDGTSSPQVTFRVMKDGVPLTTWVAGTNPQTGFTGAPSFLVAYAVSQDGINAPADFNNLGKAAAQPASISLNTLAMNTQTPDSEGYYTIALTASTAKFPANAGMRTVALQGYFTQLSPAVARHTLSVVKTVTGDAVRRAIVDAVKCAGCHEVFEGHGGNRNIGFESTGTVVCVLCHNPNLSSSGRGADLSTSASNTNTQATIALHGNAPLTYPEDTNNFKDMIHAIHASAVRAVPFEFVRDRGSSGVYSYDFSEVTFPANVKSCTLCHLPGTFDPTRIPGAALDSTLVTTDGTNATPAAVKAARATVPNATDRVIDPLTATCTSCHALSGVDNGHGPRARGADDAITPHAMGFSFTESCQACHTGSDVVVDVHGNACGLCHTAKPSRDNESSLAMLANGTAAAGSWSAVNCTTCHVDQHVTP